MCLLLLVIITVIKSEKVHSWISFAQTHLSVQQIFGESVKKMVSHWTHPLTTNTVWVKGMPFSGFHFKYFVFS